MGEFDAVVTYMSRIFPLADVCRWLCANRPYANAKLELREFSLQANGHGSMVYTKRYISGATPTALRGLFSQHRLFRVDIGAAYNIPPIEHKYYLDYAPVDKELVFDIDMDRFDGVRQCCTGKTWCEKCWCMARNSVKALHHLLVNTFGYRDILWVYSGSKGFHCWVSDDAARHLTENQRIKLCKYLWLDGASVMPEPGQFPQLVRDVLAPFFFDLYAPLHTIRAANAILCMFHEKAPERYPSKLIKNTDPHADKLAKNMCTEAREWYYSGCECVEKTAIRCAIVQTAWPRVDAGVTTSLKHTLKTPFCVHPGTQRICIPVEPATVDAFDPATAPRWTQVGSTDDVAYDAALKYFRKYIDTLDK